jgi:hypothetical protein
MLQATLVSLYGEKSDVLRDLIAECQRRVAAAAGPEFQPYDVRQVHATLFGLERTSSNFNLNFSKHRSRDVAMDLDGLAGFLRSTDLLPLRIQIGGFSKEDRPFLSRGLAPYERSFSIQNGHVVVMGWPSGSALDNLRREAQNFGILHAYRRTPEDFDNDLYFRIGLIDPGRQHAIESEMREFLASKPTVIEIGRDQIGVAIYEDSTLPLATTEIVPLSELTADRISAPRPAA